MGMEDMSFFDLVIAIYCANFMTVALVWGLSQIFKHDEEAPRLAFAAVLIPTILMIMTLISLRG